MRTTAYLDAETCSEIEHRALSIVRAAELGIADESQRDVALHACRVYGQKVLDLMADFPGDIDVSEFIAQADDDEEDGEAA